MSSERRGTVSHLVLDVDAIKNAGFITAKQRAEVRLSRDEKRMIYFINKALEAVHPEERADIFKALNIHPPDLQPISEKDILKLIEDRVVAFTKYKYHHDRRLMNYYKIKDFMDKTQRRNGNGRCIYLSKEGSKLLLRKRNIAKSMGGNIRNADGSLSNQLSNSIDRLSDHSDKRKYVAVSAANGSPNPYRANSPKLNKKRSMP